MSDTELHDFREFMKEREKAATAYVSGDYSDLSRLVAQSGDATFYAPRGGFVAGAENVSETYARDVHSFAPGSQNAFEILHMAASDRLAYWVGFQRALTNMQGSADPIPFNLRVTELFRREGDTWKLIHRHADPLIDIKK